MLVFLVVFCTLILIKSKGNGKLSNLTMSFVAFDQLPNILKKSKYEKSKFAYFVRKQPRTKFFSTQPRSKLFWFRFYMPCKTLILSLVGFEQLLGVWKKAICEKSKFTYFVRKQRETNFSSTEARSEIIFDLKSTCHEELQQWVSFHLNNFLTFWKNLYMKKVNSLISYENNQRTKFFLRNLYRKFFLIWNLNAMRNYTHSGFCTSILVAFEQLLDILK